MSKKWGNICSKFRFEIKLVAQNSPHDFDFFSIGMGADCSFALNSIETQAPHPPFFGHNKSFLG